MLRTSIKIFSLNFVVLLGFIVFLEVVSFAINKTLGIENTWEAGFESDAEADRPIENLPSKSYKRISINRDNSQKNIEYRLDQFNRRFDPHLDESRAEYLILMGDSYTYGDGIPSHETIPSIINQTQKHYSVYNYGLPGTAPHQFLKRFEKLNLRSEIKNETGAMVLLLYDMHILRANLDLSWLIASSPNQVHYWLDENERLKGGQSLRQTNPLYYYGFHILSRSNIRRLISNFISRREFVDSGEYSRSELLLYAKIIEQISLRYQEQFENNRFYVFYAGRGSPSLDREDIKYLREKGIKYFVGIELGVNILEDTLLDGHYNHNGSAKLAKNIVDKLKQMDSTEAAD